MQKHWDIMRSDDAGDIWIEVSYPMLCGTVRDHVTKERRPLVPFFACSEDVTHEPPDAPPPAAIAAGEDPFYIVGAIAGG